MPFPLFHYSSLGEESSLGSETRLSHSKVKSKPSIFISHGCLLGYSQVHADLGLRDRRVHAWLRP